jgi:hypothetical protein
LFGLPSPAFLAYLDRLAKMRPVPFVALNPSLGTEGCAAQLISQCAAADTLKPSLKLFAQSKDTAFCVLAIPQADSGVQACGMF